MSIKESVRKQYMDIVNRNAKATRKIEAPREGWLRTVRRALGMSTVQLARRLNVTRANISKIEKAELSGNVTLNTLSDFAEAMECKLIYAVVPDTDIDEILTKRASTKAKRIVENAGLHMALEKQTLNRSQIEFEIRRLQEELLRNSFGRLWDDEI